MRLLRPSSLPFACAAALGLAMFGGCSDGATEDDSDLRAGERKIVGEAVAYPADTTLAPRVSELAKSQKARREAAWKAVAKILKPISVREKTAKNDGKVVKLPLFRTWYGKDDMDRVFAKAYGDLTPADRKAGRPLTADELKKAYTWNVTSAASWSDADYIARVKQITDAQAAQGLGGNTRVSYSPGFASHLLANYAPVTRCMPKLDTFGLDAKPASATNFAPCFAAEFPADAALIKASWWRSDFGMKLPRHTTSAASLKARLAGTLDQGGWGAGEGDELAPGVNDIYTVTLSDGANFRMAGLHLVTKELRDWMWITLFWSDDPDTDFGADRPAAIKALGAPWDHYKMEVIVAYDEQDPDPRGGYTGTLGDALAAVHPGVGGPSWGSNPYIERGPKNAQTNCIGCHQHSHNQAFSSESILADEAKFPKAGRTKLRQVFPADYSWSVFHGPELLAGVLDARVRAYP
ncbi:MAG: hypothetical protein HOO96_30805 [Polyangiaceae bacterium]|nr:hypothetical protein [Polyangiaceae bacterium]